MNLVLGQSPQKALCPPFPAWQTHYVRCIEQALFYGLQQVKSKKTAVEMGRATERHITYWLYVELLDLIQGNVVPGFTRNVFELPHLDPPTGNIDDSSIQKMPDLRFHLTNAETCGRKVEKLNQYAWFCECKIIEEHHSSRTYQNYLNQGIQRFIDGQYAWAMPHAQMIAYVRWPSDATDMGADYMCLVLSSERDGNICITKHARTHSLAPIELRHLWFKFQ